MHGDGKPDKAEEKVEHYDEKREAEHCLVPLWREVIDHNRRDQHDLRDPPDKRAPFDVVISGTTGEVNLPNGELGYDVVRCGLISRVRTGPRMASPGAPREKIALLDSC